MYIEVYCHVLIDCGAKAVLKVCDNLSGGSFLDCPVLVPLQYKVNGYELSLKEKPVDYKLTSVVLRNKVHISVLTVEALTANVVGFYSMVMHLVAILTDRRW